MNPDGYLCSVIFFFLSCYLMYLTLECLCLCSVIVILLLIIFHLFSVYSQKLLMTLKSMSKKCFKNLNLNTIITNFQVIFGNFKLSNNFRKTNASALLSVYLREISNTTSDTKNKKIHLPFTTRH